MQNQSSESMMETYKATSLFIQEYEVLLTCSFALLIISSLIINLVCLFLPKRSEDFSWEPRMTFFRNLILSNLISILTVILLFIQHWAMTFSTWCKVYYFVNTVTTLISFLSISCMALERYYFVCRSGSYLVKVTQKCLRIVLVIIWIFSLSIGTMVIMLFDKSTKQNNEHGTNGGFPRVLVVFSQVWSSFALVLSLIANTFVCWKMFREAQKTVMPFNEDAYKKHKTGAFYCVMMLVQMLPLLFNIVSDALWDDQVKTSQFASAAGLHLWQLLMLLVPPIINPLLYAFKCPEIRKRLSDLFKCCTRQRGAEVQVEQIMMRPIPAQAN